MHTAHYKALHPILLSPYHPVQVTHRYASQKHPSRRAASSTLQLRPEMRTTNATETRNPTYHNSYRTGAIQPWLRLLMLLPLMTSP